jgi:CubicO group peptidase (beta-lactamase class C family)
MTKSVLNALIGIRVRQGKLALNQTALFPEWCEAPHDARCGISVLQLLQMSSGLHFDETYGPFSGATRMLFANSDVAKFAIGHKYGKGAHASAALFLSYTD